MGNIIQGYQGFFDAAREVVIDESETKSGVLSLKGMTLVGIHLPAAFDGAALTFEACDTEDGTFVPVNDKSGTAVTYTVTQATYAAIDPKDFYGINFLKIVSGSAESAARTLKCAVKGL